MLLTYEMQFVLWRLNEALSGGRTEGQARIRSEKRLMNAAVERLKCHVHPLPALKYHPNQKTARSDQSDDTSSRPAGGFLLSLFQSL